ncbi:MAG: tripartite tricarboxylate transporter TctB family protein [Burkholderiales bacterium]|nr:tripartite tricarboxylate transporter TctB family protein [Burkholderiales bacterium]
MIADRIIFVCIIVLAAVYYHATKQIPTLDIGDPLGPRAFPHLLVVCLLATAVLLLVEILKARVRGLEGSAGAAPDAGERGTRHLLLIGAVVVWTALYFALFDVLGYLVATAVYLFAMMAWLHRGHWGANVLTAVLFSAGSYVLFVKLLTVNLAKGIFSF